MTRRELLRAGSIALAGLLAGCLPGTPAAAPSKRLPRIGYLALVPPPSGQVDPFIQGLRDLGYVDGQTVTIETRYVNAMPERLDAFVAELVALNVDVLAVANGPYVVAVGRQTATIPTVVLSAGDPVGQGVAQSLSHPGGNVTGLSSDNVQTYAKEIELLHELLPSVSQVGWVTTSSSTSLTVNPAVEAAAHTLGIGLQLIPLDRSEDMEGAFQAAASSNLEALYIQATPVNIGASGQLAALTTKYRLATVGVVTQRSAIVGYGARTSELARRGAGYVDRILKGEKPADMPIAEPTVFDLVVNVKLAQTIGLSVPQSLLAQATEVIQ